MIRNVEDIKKARKEIKEEAPLKKELEDVCREFANMIKEDLNRCGEIDKDGVFIQGIKDKVYIQHFK